MKRREFTKGLVAAGLSPALPLKALATASSTGAATVAANFTPFMYSWSVTHARGLGQCSTDVLMSKLGIGADTASAICSRMVKQGVISAPNALGVSKALAQKTPLTSFKPVKDVPKSANRGPVGASERTSQPLKRIDDSILHASNEKEDITEPEVPLDDTELKPHQQD